MEQGRATTLHSLTGVPGARRVCDGVSVGGDIPTDAPAEKVRTLSGSAEWEARQLEREVHRGMWRVLPSGLAHRYVWSSPEEAWASAVEALATGEANLVRSPILPEARS